MRRIDLSQYTVSIQRPDPATGTVRTEDVRFDVGHSITTILFGQGVDGRELLKRDAIAKKIEAAGAEDVLLEEEEYQTVLNAFRAWKTFSRHEVEMLRRIENAPQVNVAALARRPNRKRSRG